MLRQVLPFVAIAAMPLAPFAMIFLGPAAAVGAFVFLAAAIALRPR